MSEFGLPPDANTFLSEAHGINDQGQVVGTNYSRVFLWTPSTPNATTGTLSDLGTPPSDYAEHDGAAINASGQVVGTNYVYTVSPEAFLWSPDVPNGNVGTIATFGSPFVRAAAVNARGQAAGANFSGGAPMFTPNEPNGSNGVLTTLPLPVGYDNTKASGINDAGEVVGTAWGEYLAAFRWIPETPNGTTGTTALLPSFVGGGSTRAYDINNHGEIVGHASGLSTGDAAVLWTSADGILDLNTLLDEPLPPNWLLREAVSINDRGQIAANGVFWDGGAKPVFHAFLLTPVPEPGVSLLAAVSCCIVLRHRARRTGSP